MGKLRDYLEEARNKQVPTEFRIALGQLKRMYNAGEVPEKKELEKDAQMIAKKNHIEEDKFLEFAIAQFKMNESKMETGKFDNIINLLNTKRTEQAKADYKALSKMDKELFSNYLSKSKVNIEDEVKKLLKINESRMKGEIKVNDIISIKGIDGKFKILKFDGSKPRLASIAGSIIPKRIDLDNITVHLSESAVGKPGRTTEKDAEDHIDDELIAEFKKIIKKLGGKTVAKVLLDKLSQKAEIKDEIEHIEDLIDNSNY